jgi:fermentation-respiration switch protein FrsA (DUF1100 family)
MIKQYMDYTEAALRQIKEKGSFPPNPPQGLGAIFNPSAASLIRSYVTIDSTDNLKAFNGPVLVMQGDKDIQISVERDLPLLEKTLRKRGGKFEVKVIPSASHNLKLVLDASKEMGLTGPIAAEATSALIAWAKANL